MSTAVVVERFRAVSWLSGAEVKILGMQDSSQEESGRKYTNAITEQTGACSFLPCNRPGQQTKKTGSCNCKQERKVLI
jgi:hypothetical protein